MTDDGRLLEQWKRQKSQAAFAALVTRHLDFVYSVCLRETQDAALAEDTTQVVFLLLSRKSPSFGPDTRLTGWLFQTARFACKNARRRDASRRRLEQNVGQQMLSEAQGQDALWEQVAPHLNAALVSLGAKDREAVLLRFADGLSFSELGTALGTSEDAARMRLNRALTRLRGFFAKQGVSVTALVLTDLLADRATQAAPMTCTAAAQQMAAHNMALVPPQTNVHLQGVLHAMKLTKITAAVAACFAVGATGLIVKTTQPASAQAVNAYQIDKDTQSINEPLSHDPAVRVAAQVRRMERAMFLRDRWQPWAQRHQAILRQMLNAKTSDTQAVAAVWQALPALPDRASQSHIAGISRDDIQINGGLFTWDPGVKGAVTVPPNLKEHYAKSNAWFTQRLRDDWNKYHDIRLSESVNTGRSHTVLWVSGRVTTMTDTDQFVGHGLPFKEGEDCQENAPVYDFLQ